MGTRARPSPPSGFVTRGSARRFRALPSPRGRPIIQKSLKERRLPERTSPPNGFLTDDTWRIFRIMAEFVEGFETLSTVPDSPARPPVCEPSITDTTARAVVPS